MTKMVERYEDMSPLGKLRLIWQEDGDILIAIVPDPKACLTHNDSVEFCIPGFGGGGSENTHKALIGLFRSMEKDNQETPQNRKGKTTMCDSTTVSGALRDLARHFEPNAETMFTKHEIMTILLECADIVDQVLSDTQTCKKCNLVEEWMRDYSYNKEDFVDNEKALGKLWDIYMTEIEKEKEGV